MRVKGGCLDSKEEIEIIIRRKCKYKEGQFNKTLILCVLKWQPDRASKSEQLGGGRVMFYKIQIKVQLFNINSE